MYVIIRRVGRLFMCTFIDGENFQLSRACVLVCRTKATVDGVLCACSCVTVLNICITKFSADPVRMICCLVDVES
jgi:hypothetical protein